VASIHKQCELPTSLRSAAVTGVTWQVRSFSLELNEEVKKRERTG
jgi:hypothetical protein